ncbi:MAG: sensor histidine kinase [bacterium]
MSTERDEMNEACNAYRILIVDDVPRNIQVLANILKEAGYQLGFAKDGKAALAHMESTRFDLILLDIMMPGVDGYEVCEQIKRHKRTRDIPVIFITALHGTENKTKGFELGAVDYITKPFDALEVLARVKTHLTIREYATQLERLVEERTRQLMHADRLATLGTFAAAIIHEINNPLSYIIGNTKLLEMFWSTARPILEAHAGDDKTGQLCNDVKEIDGWLKYLGEGCHRIAQLVKSLKSYSRQSTVHKGHFLLADIINDALRLVSHKIKIHAVMVQVSVPPDLKVYCDPQKISQVFVNLIDNACDAVPDQTGRITITAAMINGHASVRIKDNGPGISGGIGEEIFNPFFTTKGNDIGTGLGLFIVRKIIEEHNGRISLSPADGTGTEFTVLLPVEGK